jgi:site-specific DNA-adenine methylase
MRFLASIVENVAKMSVREFLIDRKVSVDKDYTEQEFERDFVPKLGIHRDLSFVVFNRHKTKGLFSVNKFIQTLEKYQKNNNSPEKKQEEPLRKTEHGLIISKDNPVLKNLVTKFEQTGVCLLKVLEDLKFDNEGNLSLSF